MLPSENNHGALDGIRVLEVAGGLGSYAARILGDLGANIVKVEPPGGDPSRRLAPFAAGPEGPVSLAFVH